MTSAELASQWDARSVASAGMHGLAQVEPWVAGNSPAAAVMGEGFVLVIGAVPAPFDLPELRRLGVTAHVPLNGAGLRGSVRAFGARLFRRTDVECVIAVPVDANSAAGIGVGASHWHFSGHSGALSWHVGAGYLIATEVVRLGVEVRADFAARATAPVFFALRGGVDLSASPTVRIGWEFEQSPERPLDIRYGLTVTAVRGFEVMAGLSDQTGAVGGGVTLRGTGWWLSAGSNVHPLLGWTHAVTLTIRTDG